MVKTVRMERCVLLSKTEQASEVLEIVLEEEHSLKAESPKVGRNRAVLESLG